MLLMYNITVAFILVYYFPKMCFMQIIAERTTMCWPVVRSYFCVGSCIKSLFTLLNSLFAVCYSVFITFLCVKWAHVLFYTAVIQVLALSA